MAFWFGRKSAPERPQFVPAWLTGEGEQGGFVRGYAARLDEVYRRNPVGLRAVRLVAGLTGGLPIFGDERAVKLVKTDGLLERIAASLLLHGNAYARLVTNSDDRPAVLHLMRPERVSVSSGADGWPSAYLYRAGGQAVRIAKEDALGRRQVAHLKALDPSDDHYGVGCLEAAVGAASVHNRASRWNKALLDNWASVTHAVGDRFCLIDVAAMKPVTLSAGSVGTALTATAHGIGDIAPLPVAERLICGESLRPPSPCHLTLRRDGTSLAASWTRRSHRGWAWIDGVGVPDDPFPETYRLNLTGAGGTLTSESANCSAAFSLAELPGTAGEAIAVAVSIVGPAALSHPATASIIL